jgi:hypothetical protein
VAGGPPAAIRREFPHDRVARGSQHSNPVEQLSMVKSTVESVGEDLGGYLVESGPVGENRVGNGITQSVRYIQRLSIPRHTGGGVQLSCDAYSTVVVPPRHCPPRSMDPPQPSPGSASHWPQLAGSLLNPRVPILSSRVPRLVPFFPEHIRLCDESRSTLCDQMDIKHSPPASLQSGAPLPESEGEGEGEHYYSQDEDDSGGAENGDRPRKRQRRPMSVS